MVRFGPLPRSQGVVTGATARALVHEAQTVSRLNRLNGAPHIMHAVGSVAERSISR